MRAPALAGWLRRKAGEGTDVAISAARAGGGRRAARLVAGSGFGAGFALGSGSATVFGLGSASRLVTGLGLGGTGFAAGFVGGVTATLRAIAVGCGWGTDAGAG
jgi:hypothetical protein